MKHLWKRFWPMPASASFNARPELSETLGQVGLQRIMLDFCCQNSYGSWGLTRGLLPSTPLQPADGWKVQQVLDALPCTDWNVEGWVHELHKLLSFGRKIFSTFWGVQAELRRENDDWQFGVWIVLELALFSCQVLQTLPEYHMWPVLHLGWVHQQRSWLMFSHWMPQVRWTTPYLTSLRISGGDGDVANPVVLPTILASLAGGRCPNWTSVASW